MSDPTSPRDDISVEELQQQLQDILRDDQEALKTAGALRVAQVVNSLGKRLGEDRAELEVRLAEADHTIEELKDENRTLTHKLAAYEETSKKALDEVSLQGQVAELRAAVAALEAELETQKVLVKEAYEENEHMREAQAEQIEQLNWENAYLTSTVRQLEKGRHAQRSLSPEEDGDGEQERERKTDSADSVKKKKKSGKGLSVPVRRRFASFTLTRNVMRSVSTCSL